MTTQAVPTKKEPHRPEAPANAPRPSAVPPGNPDAIDEVPALEAILVYEHDEDVAPPPAPAGPGPGAKSRR